jgi:hypothetical protein
MEVPVLDCGDQLPRRVNYRRTYVSTTSTSGERGRGEPRDDFERQAPDKPGGRLLGWR